LLAVVVGDLEEAQAAVLVDTGHQPGHLVVARLLNLLFH